MALYDELLYPCSSSCFSVLYLLSLVNSKLLVFNIAVDLVHWSLKFGEGGLEYGELYWKYWFLLMILCFATSVVTETHHMLQVLEEGIEKCGLQVSQAKWAAFQIVCRNKTWTDTGCSLLCKETEFRFLALRIICLIWAWIWILGTKGQNLTLIINLYQ